MDNFDLKEKVYGGIFGVISIIAAIAEMFVNGISVSSILGAIKDVSGTLVVVVLLVAVVKSLIPKKYKKTFEERLTDALINWEKANSNMIVKDDSYAAGYSLEMRTNVIDFYKSVPITSKSGWFVRLPIVKVENYNKGNIEINFHLNKGTFFNHRPKEEDLKNAVEAIKKYKHIDSVDMEAHRDLIIDMLYSKNVLGFTYLEYFLFNFEKVPGCLSTS